MQKIKCFILEVCIFFLKIVYAFIKLFPVKEKVTFISRQGNEPSLDFSLLAKELKKERPTCQIVMLTKKLDNKLTYIFHMFKQMYHVATSKVVILDSYCIVISVLKHKKSLTVIQIWHAIGSMKKFGYAMIGKDEGSSPEIAKVMRMHKNYDIILISSFSFIKDFEEGFAIDKSKVKEIPLPRVDLLLDKKYKEQVRNKLYKKIPQLKDKKNILYCSTFRKQQPNNCKNIDDLVKEIDFSKYNLLYKPHPFNTIKSNDKRIITDFSSTFEALFVADYVICDYSSIIYEVGLLDLPLYLYAYDWEEYKTKRELNFDIEKEPGVLFTADPQKIIYEIENVPFDNRQFQKFVHKNVTLPKGSCTKKIVRLIIKYL